VVKGDTDSSNLDSDLDSDLDSNLDSDFSDDSKEVQSGATKDKLPENG
jgi:hypothetical protein